MRLRPLDSYLYEIKSLEEVAKDYLKALVERNLLFVRLEKSNGRPRSYLIHDLLRDLSIRKANEEKFLHVKNSLDVTFSGQRHVSVDSSYDEMEPQLMSLARSFICTGNGILSPIFSISRLVRVVDVLSVQFKEFPEEILRLVNLRY